MHDGTHPMNIAIQHFEMSVTRHDLLCGRRSRRHAHEIAEELRREGVMFEVVAERVPGDDAIGDEVHPDAIFEDAS